MASRRAEPGEIIDLGPLGDRLAEVKTSALARTPSFEAARLVVREGTEIARHHVPGRIMVHCIEDAVDLGLADSPRRIRAGEWIWLGGGEPQSLHGIEDASLPLTILIDS